LCPRSTSQVNAPDPSVSSPEVISRHVVSFFYCIKRALPRRHDGGHTALGWGHARLLREAARLVRCAALVSSSGFGECVTVCGAACICKGQCVRRCYGMTTWVQPTETQTTNANAEETSVVDRRTQRIPAESSTPRHTQLRRRRDGPQSHDRRNCTPPCPARTCIHPMEVGLAVPHPVPPTKVGTCSCRGTACC
jgi:hypothetical protein